MNCSVHEFLFPPKHFLRKKSMRRQLSELVEEGRDQTSDPTDSITVGFSDSEEVGIQTSKTKGECWLLFQSSFVNANISSQQNQDFDPVLRSRGSLDPFRHAPARIVPEHHLQETPVMITGDCDLRERHAVINNILCREVRVQRGSPHETLCLMHSDNTEEKTKDKVLKSKRTLIALTVSCR